MDLSTGAIDVFLPKEDEEVIQQILDAEESTDPDFFNTPADPLVIDYFSLAYDEKAQDYLEGYDVQKLMPQVKEKLMDMNSNPTGNKLIPYDNMVINKVRFLNHRWIIADFTGDSNWGEVILKYFLEKDGSVTFETAETVMYPQQ